MYSILARLTLSLCVDLVTEPSDLVWFLYPSIRVQTYRVPKLSVRMPDHQTQQTQIRKILQGPLSS